MENHRKEKNVWMAVPQFGGWDQKTSRTDYSMVFQRARANRKQNKIDMHRPSLSYGNEQELITQQQRDQSPSRKKKLLKYLSCCKG